MTRLALVIAVLLPVACASTSKRTETVRARAARDLPCPAQSVEVTHLSRDNYRARGCGGEVLCTCGIEINGKFSCNR